MSENALEYRVPTGLVVNLSATTNQMYRQKSILLDWLVAQGMARL
jgi:hypothetical protein